MLNIKKIEAAINQISAEKKIPKETLIEIIELAIKTAYKKDYGTKDENIIVRLNIEAGTIEITIEKTVVKKVTKPSLEISFDDLGDDAKDYEEGDIIELDITDEVLNSSIGESFGRIASQSAKQVIIQKIGETEKQKIYELFKDKVGQVISMKVVIVESGKVVLDYNGNQITLLKSEQVSRDNYIPDVRFYLYIAEASCDDKNGPKVTISRKNKDIVPSIFSLYVPEISEGIINIDNVSRFPGVKTKLLVSTNNEEVDPAGSLIGPKGTRVKSVMEELSGEKIDIIVNNGNIGDIIAKSLTPANIIKVEVDEENLASKVYLLSSQRSKAIGKGGININLASNLTGYNISLVEIKD